MNDLPDRLRVPTPLIGTLVTVDSPEAAEALALAGVEWLFLDAEHSPVLNPAAVQRIVQAVAGRAYTLVRVPYNDEVWIKQALDAGASGVIVPHVRDAAEARRAVDAAKYPPLGSRSVGIARAHDYGLDFAGYLARANRATAVILQIEDADAVTAIDAILAVDGVDGLFVGPYDLSGSLGRLGRVQDPEVQEAVAAVVTGGRKAGMPLGIYAANGAAARDAVDQGFGFLAVGTDLGHLVAAVRGAVAEATAG